MALTNAQRLAQTETAITKIEAGLQSITSPDGRTSAFALLRDLYAERRRVQGLIARADGKDRRVPEF